jgi:hypothetical protein
MSLIRCQTRQWCKVTTDTQDIYMKLLFSMNLKDQAKCKFKIPCSKTFSKLSLQCFNNNNWMFLHFICDYHMHLTLLTHIIAIQWPPFPTTQTGLAHILLYSFCICLLVTLMKNCTALFLLYCILNTSFQNSVHMEDTKLFISPVCTVKQRGIIIKCKII